MRVCDFIETVEHHPDGWYYQEFAKIEMDLSELEIKLKDEDITNIGNLRFECSKDIYTKNNKIFLLKEFNGYKFLLKRIYLNLKTVITTRLETENCIIQLLEELSDIKGSILYNTLIADFCGSSEISDFRLEHHKSEFYIIDAITGVREVIPSIPYSVPLGHRIQKIKESIPDLPIYLTRTSIINIKRAN